jgi:hypothetical protein
MKTLKEIGQILVNKYLEEFDKSKNHYNAKSFAIQEIKKVDRRARNPETILQFKLILDSAFKKTFSNQ